jgi:hypothetical protein
MARSSWSVRIVRADEGAMVRWVRGWVLCADAGECASYSDFATMPSKNVRSMLPTW